jgi:hypothetical protein
MLEHKRHFLQLHPLPAADAISVSMCHTATLRCSVQQLVLINKSWQTYWTVITVRAVKLGFDAVICVLRQAILSFICVICRLQYPEGRENKAHQRPLVGGRRAVLAV